MTLTKQCENYISYYFGNVNHCCAETGLTWTYFADGVTNTDSGGTAYFLGSLIFGALIGVTQMTITSPPGRGTFTLNDVTAQNGGIAPTLDDASYIALHDTPAEGQICYIPCINHQTPAECATYGCSYWNLQCNDSDPASGELINNPTDCETFDFYWYNTQCHTSAPTNGETLNNQTDCVDYNYFWYGIPPSCHTSNQPNLCYWIDSKGGARALTVSNIFSLVSSYLQHAPPSGYTFIPTVQNIFGTVAYYLDQISNGNTKTGCSYI